MAKLYKIELYIADYNDVYQDVDNVVNSIEGSGLENAIVNCFNPQVVNVEWYDDIDLNYDSANKQTYEKYFKKSRKG